MRRPGQVLLALGSLLAFGSAYMHGFMARRAVLGRLPSDLAPETVEGLNAAWILGTAAMAAFGILVLTGLSALGRDRGASRVPLAAGGFFLIYGIWAFVYRDFHPHLTGFMVIGALFIAGAVVGSRGSGRG
jgi:hypothetical protein